ncbi:MAG TPA: YihY/virulence factor BrkB family protein, partial [Thermomicrobiales bacterium]|nr:YihY/virulence factor BrkB family protein [Thermomicrobiales bacterium]
SHHDTESTLAELKDDFTRIPLKDLGKRTVKKIGSDQITTLSGAFAYNWTFSLPPLILLIVLIGALINRVTTVPVVENLRDLINRRAPAETQEMLLKLVDNAVAQVSGGAASIGAIFTALLALWAASNAIGVLITGFNRAYEVQEDRSFIRKRAIQLGLTLLLVLFVNVAFALLLFGQQIGRWLADWIGLGSQFDTIWSISRWPGAILGIMLMLAVLYWAGPNVDQPFRWVSIGSVIATLAWLALVAGFNLYLDVSNPGTAYGVVGSLIVLLVFLNLTGIIFFLGAEINAILFAAVADHPVGIFRGPAMAVANQ